jgi:hypothetical protein
MKQKLPMIMLIVLSLCIIAEKFIYGNIKSNVIMIESVQKKEKVQSGSEIGRLESDKSEAKFFGYGEVLELLKNNPGLNITHIKRNDDTEKKVFVKIEFISEEGNIESTLSRIYDMKNFIGISKLVINNNDENKKNIILDGEFKIN